MMEKEGYDFMDVVNNETAGVNRDDIPNMDQTLLPFSYHLSSTLEQKGAKTVTLAASTKRATLAASLTGSGKLLTPFLIFKGEKNGRIGKKELSKHPEGCRCACQKKALMD
jgi:hypothetical protein